MGIIRKGLLAGATFMAIHALRKKRLDNQSHELNSTGKNRPFNDNTSTSENTMPDVSVNVEPSSAKH